MNEITKIIINALTLGIPAIIEACRKESDSYEYAKKKNGRCRHSKRCCYSCCCMETLEDCKRLHHENNHKNNK